jgi:vacuolar protein sorting-associated protein 53
VKYEDTQEIF